MNTEGEEAEEASFKPPPKMAEMSVPPGGPLNNFVNNANIPQPPMEQQNYSQNPMPMPMPTPIAAPQNSFNAPLPNNAPVDTTTTKTPSLQSNMFKMQRNKSEN